jgi:putative sigma-54 modulation protein
MKLIVNGRNIELTDAIKAYVEEKTTKLEHHYDFIKEIIVFLSVDKNPSIHNNQHAEATVMVPGAVVRVEVSTDSLYASIDKLIDKIDRALRKHKTKLLHRAKSGRSQHGDTIRRTGLDEALAEERAVQQNPLDDEDEIEGVSLTYHEEEDESETSGTRV